MSSTGLDFSLSSRQVFHTESTTYRVIERLGEGGNSNVYLCLALDGTLKGLLFAVKFMINVAKSDRVARFKSELEFLGQISHPGITRVFDSGSLTFGPAGRRIEVPFYVAEYLPKTLADAMRAGMLMVDKVSVALQLVSTLAFLATDAVNVLHRDIKPENIFFRGRSAVLGDFGLLKALESSELAEKFDIGGLSRGPRHPYLYPTPELIAYAKSSDSPICGKSDVFQLGLVLAQLFCGAHPMKPRAATLDEIELADLEAFQGSNSGTIAPLISQMLELEVARRPTAADLCDRWDGVFSEVVSDAQRLEGRAFW